MEPDTIPSDAPSDVVIEVPSGAPSEAPSDAPSEAPSDAPRDALSALSRTPSPSLAGVRAMCSVACAVRGLVRSILADWRRSGRGGGTWVVRAKEDSE